MIKTLDVNFSQVCDGIKDLHSYELPELLVVPVAWGTDGYLEWVNASTRT